VIAVRSASATRPGFGRIELVLTTRNPDADYEDRTVERRTLTAAALRVAAELEGIAAAEHLECDVSVASARQGIIDVDFRSDGFGVDAIDEILIEACGNVGLAPAEDEGL